jgi:hypothetical protein
MERRVQFDYSLGLGLHATGRRRVGGGTCRHDPIDTEAKQPAICFTIKLKKRLANQRKSTASRRRCGMLGGGMELQEFVVTKYHWL